MFFTFFDLLKQSVTSHKFYQQVVLHYKGYGIRYLFMVSFLSTLLYAVLILFSFNNTISALKGENIIFGGKNIEYIVSQLPSLMVEENNLTPIDKPSPYYINNLDNYPVILFDSDNIIVMSEKEKVPIVVSPDGVTINVFGARNIVLSKEDLALSNISMSAMDLRLYIAGMMEGVSSNIVWVMFPLMLLLRTLFIVTDKLFLCVVIYFVLGVVYQKCPKRWQTALRATIFVSVPAILLKPLLFIPIPGIGIIPTAMQFWTMFLLGKALYAVNVKNRAGMLN